MGEVGVRRLRRRGWGGASFGLRHPSLFSLTFSSNPRPILCLPRPHMPACMRQGQVAAPKPGGEVMRYGHGCGSRPFEGPGVGGEAGGERLLSRRAGAGHPPPAHRQFVPRLESFVQGRLPSVLPIPALGFLGRRMQAGVSYHPLLGRPRRGGAGVQHPPESAGTQAGADQGWGHSGTVGPVLPSRTGAGSPASLVGCGTKERTRFMISEAAGVRAV